MDIKMKLEDILKNLYNVSGFTMTIFDANQNAVASYPTNKSTFCSMITSTEEGEKLCFKSDHHGFEECKKINDLYIYKCPFGLYEALAPLYYLGELSGYLMMGQTLDHDPKAKDTVFRLSKDIIKDHDLLQSKIDDINIKSLEQLISCTKIMNICSSYITLTNSFKRNYANLAERVKEYIISHYAEKLSLDILTEVFYCSRVTLTTSFKNKYNITINDFIIETRISNSCSLLKNTNKTIKEISSLCGFSDQNYFSKTFKKIMGITPNEYRVGS